MNIPELAFNVAELFAILLAAYQVSKRFPLERQSITAEANSDNAIAQKTTADAAGIWLENYNRMFALVQQRDNDLLNLTKRLNELTAMERERDQELYELTEKISSLASRHESEIEMERTRRIAAEQERDLLKEKLAKLEEVVHELQQKITNLTNQSIPVQ